MDNTQGLTAIQRRPLDFPQVIKLGLEKPLGLSGSPPKPCNNGYAASLVLELPGGVWYPPFPGRERGKGRSESWVCGWFFVVLVILPLGCRHHEPLFQWTTGQQQFLPKENITFRNIYLPQ